MEQEGSREGGREGGAGRTCHVGVQLVVAQDEDDVDFQCLGREGGRKGGRAGGRAETHVRILDEPFLFPFFPSLFPSLPSLPPYLH